MTLIVTSISKLGIIQASDSNLTGGGAVRAGRKVFQLDFVPGALAIAGTYGVGGTPMDAWMPRCIADYSASGAPSLGGFAEHLAARLQDEMTEPERNSGSLTQIAGYARTGEGSHPEMHLVTNISTINAVTGQYEGIGRDFSTTEDFWRRDYPFVKEKNPFTFATGDNQRYFNGTSEGRITYRAVSDMLYRFYEGAWDKRNWQFKRPESLDAQAEQLGVAIRAIGALYRSSDYPDPYIGGDVQTELVFPPDDAISL
jgi:hypothetical protein